jgi:lipopolysaccharide biosynthesis regulator YciM
LHPLFLLELARWRLARQQESAALELLGQALHKAPGLMAAHELRGQLLLKAAAPTEDAFKALLAQIKDSKSTSYRCRHCGFTSYYLSWQCPRCRHWDTITVLTY